MEISQNSPYLWEYFEHIRLESLLIINDYMIVKFLKSHLKWTLEIPKIASNTLLVENRKRRITIGEKF